MLRNGNGCLFTCDLKSRLFAVLTTDAIERVGLTYSSHWLRGDFRPYEMKPLEKLEHSLLFLCLPSDKFAISDKETLKVICKDFELSTAVKELVSNMNWEEKYPTVSPIFPQMSNELFFDILSYTNSKFSFPVSSNELCSVLNLAIFVVPSCTRATVT